MFLLIEEEGFFRILHIMAHTKHGSIYGLRSTPADRPNHKHRPPHCLIKQLEIHELKMNLTEY